MSQALYRFSADGKRMRAHGQLHEQHVGPGASTRRTTLFGSTANNDHSVYVRDPAALLPGRAPGLRRRRQEEDRRPLRDAGQHAEDPPGRRAWAGSPPRPGHNFYTARAFPQEYWNRIAFVNEPTGHVVHRAIIERKGSGFAEARRLEPRRERRRVDGAGAFRSRARRRASGSWTSTTSSSSTTRRRAGRTRGGYTYLNGRGNAYDTPLRESHARPHLSRSPGRAPSRTRRWRCSADRPAELVAALKNDNMFWRTTAQRLLVERGKTGRAAAAVRRSSPIARWTRSVSTRRARTRCGRCTDWARSTATNAQALDVAKRALTHPAAGVRKAAQSVLPKTAATLADLVAAKALDRHGSERAPQRDPRRLPSCRRRSRPAALIYAASKQKEVRSDEWLSEAVYRRGRASPGRLSAGVRLGRRDHRVHAPCRQGRARRARVVPELVGHGLRRCGLEDADRAGGLARYADRHAARRRVVPARDHRARHRGRQGRHDAARSRHRVRLRVRQRVAGRDDHQPAQRGPRVRHSARRAPRRARTSSRCASATRAAVAASCPTPRSRTPQRRRLPTPA